MILELKSAKKYSDMKSLCHQALEQIEERDYAASLRTEGYQNIKKYGICFYKKECLVL